MLSDALDEPDAEPQPDADVDGTREVLACALELSAGLADEIIDGDAAAVSDGEEPRESDDRRDSVGRTVADVRPVGLTDTDAVELTVGSVVADAENVGDTLDACVDDAHGLTEVDRDARVETLPLGVPVCDCDALPESDALAVMRTEADTEGEAVELLQSVAEVDGCRDGVLPPLPVDDDEGLPETPTDPLATETVGETLCNPLDVTDTLAEGTPEKEAEGDSVTLLEGDALCDVVGDGVCVVLPVEHADAAALPVLLSDTDGETEAQAVATPLLDALEDGVGVREPLGDCNADCDRGTVKDARVLTDVDGDGVTEIVARGDALKLTDDVSEIEDPTVADTLTDAVPETDVFTLTVGDGDDRDEALANTEALCDFETSGLEETEAELFTERLGCALRDADGDAVLDVEITADLE
jgi:hypothetical protein